MALAVLVCLTLAACGFRSLYGPTPAPDTAEAVSELDDTWVAVIEGRTGQILRNRLTTALTPRGKPSRPAYRLAINLDEWVSTAAQRTDETATRANLNLAAHFIFVDNASDQVLLRGSTDAVVGYDLVDSEVATLSARRNAVSQAVEILVVDIRSRLAAHLQNRAARAERAAR